MVLGDQIERSNCSMVVIINRIKDVIVRIFTGIKAAVIHFVTHLRQILVVDDEDLFRNSVAEALEISIPNIAVLQAGHGAEALEVFLRHEPSLVVTDLDMPVMTGYELLAELARRQVSTPIIVLTACSGSSARDQVLTGGAIACLEKPINLDILAKNICDLLDYPNKQLSAVSITGFAQLLNLEKKTCCLVVESSFGLGQIYFQNGEIIHAELGDSFGDPVAIKMLQADSTTFGVVNYNYKKIETRTIYTSLAELILLSAVQADEKNAPKLTTSAHLVKAKERKKHSSHKEETTMTTVETSLKKGMAINGAIAIALVDYESGFALGKMGGGEYFDIEAAAAGNTEVVRAKMRVMKQLHLGERIDDILITLEAQYHIIRPLKREKSLFLYLAIDRESGNLAMARHQLKGLEDQLKV